MKLNEVEPDELVEQALLSYVLAAFDGKHAAYLFDFDMGTEEVWKYLKRDVALHVCETRLSSPEWWDNDDHA